MALYLPPLLTLLVLGACSSGGDSSAAFGGPGAWSGSGSPPPRTQSSTPAQDAGVADSTYYLQLSTDDSTSVASAQIAKTGQLGETLHRHEVLNYYDPAWPLFDVEPWAIEANPSAGIELGLEAVMGAAAEVPDGAAVGTVELLFEMRAASVDHAARRPWHLVFCVDVSGSMEGEKIAFVRDALAEALASLRDGDTVSLVTFESTSRTVFVDRKWPADEAAIRSAFAALEPLGGTDMMSGLTAAYKVAQGYHAPSRLSRVMLFGDGDANVGDVDIANFASLTRIENQEGIYLSSVGVGYGFDWQRMDRLADAGKGASMFLPDATEVARIFGADFSKLVEVAAEDVTIEMQIPVGLRLLDFTGEETSTDPNAPVPSIILASGDDLTFLVRFAIDDAAALDAPTSLRVRYRLLGTGEEVVYEKTVPSFMELVRTPGVLHARTRLVDAYARHVVTDPSAPSAADIVDSIDAHAHEDLGLTEIRALLTR